MSDAILKLVQAPEAEKEQKGTRYTPAEIHQQPEMWEETYKICEGMKSQIQAFLGGETDRKGLERLA